MYNGHHDVTKLINPSGAVLAGYYYDAFGNITEQTGDTANPYTYAGYFFDSEVNLYYLKARFYDARIARFMTEDTYHGKPGDALSLNLYTYCANNPLIYYDPTGHASTPTVTLPNGGGTVNAVIKNGITYMPNGSRPPVGSIVNTGNASGDKYLVVKDSNGVGGVGGKLLTETSNLKSDTKAALNNATNAINKATSGLNVTTTGRAVLNNSYSQGRISANPVPVLTLSNGKSTAVLNYDGKNFTGEGITVSGNGKIIDATGIIKLIKDSDDITLSRLVDASHSVYLKEGDREKTLNFLHLSMYANGRNGSLDLSLVARETNLESRALLGAVKKLSGLHGEAQMDDYLAFAMEGMTSQYKRTPWYVIDEEAYGIISSVSAKTQQDVNSSGFNLPKINENTIIEAEMTADTVTDAAYAMLGYASSLKETSPNNTNQGSGSKLNIDDAQFGKKIGKHAQDYGLDPSDPNARNILRNTIDDVYSNATEVRQGDWRGLGEKLPNGANASGQARFYIQGNDVVVTDLNGNFVTILKDGINNPRVMGGTKILP